ncbi:DUF1488 domain-containing protein [Vibrio plantisponsor]|jgi:hypothetical protein|uniref:DUF1488 domain-containing protein n=1 Tax=Vibrio plantisponsor TaxID=664643 RepID=A0ABU4ILZ2_9VIBR|nr:DUF1488 domain-containing protein [Vibrio plantisponsor]MDW6018525.1 DUF1488 domain-containing protein [Vibrio plantisponsor]NNM42279.1 DUF1488 domain-containing protein [Vibrio plantisponsor]PNH85422.1 DUF1488 domain-containing protein [Vibrio diazotrophicus]
MNQSILFPDMQEWNSELQAVTFPAQQSGALIECIVTLDELAKISGVTISSEQEALAAFEMVRFDLEELAEELIEDEAFNQLGQIEVVS